MSTLLTIIGGLWIVLGLLGFFGAWFGKLPRLDFPPGATAPEKLMIQLLVSAAVSLELIIAVLLLSFGVLFVVASHFS